MLFVMWMWNHDCWKRGCGLVEKSTPQAYNQNRQAEPGIYKGEHLMKIAIVCGQQTTVITQDEGKRAGLLQLHAFMTDGVLSYEGIDLAF